jgi:hypothetical protein
VDWRTLALSPSAMAAPQSSRAARLSLLFSSLREIIAVRRSLALNGTAPPEPVPPPNRNMPKANTEPPGENISP